MIKISGYKPIYICKDCGFKVVGSSNNYFLDMSQYNICPKCGAENDIHADLYNGEKQFKKKIGKFIDKSKWWNPFTWGNGYWEIKED